MGLNWQKPGVNHVGEYQVSGHILPIAATNGIQKLKFVAKAITFTNTNAGEQTVTFYDSGHTGIAFDVEAGTSIRVEGKFLTFEGHSDISALVELTGIPSGSYTPPAFSTLKH